MSLKKIWIFLFYFSIHSIQANDHLFTIMLDPAGDAQHTGRLIQDTLERGISLQCVEQLKIALTERFNNVRVVITRLPGETIQILQNASFANRLGTDLYLSFHFYQEQEQPCHIILYHYLENKTDVWHQPKNLTLYPINQAHLASLKRTKKFGLIMLETFEDKQISKHFKTRGFFGIPFQPLLGIQAPAIAIEVGLAEKNDWKNLIQPIIKALERIIP